MIYNGIQIQQDNKSAFYVATKKYQTLLQVYYIIHLVGAVGHFSFWRVKPQLLAVPTVGLLKTTIHDANTLYK